MPGVFVLILLAGVLGLVLPGLIRADDRLDRRLCELAEDDLGYELHDPQSLLLCQCGRGFYTVEGSIFHVMMDHERGE